MNVKMAGAGRGEVSAQSSEPVGLDWRKAGEGDPDFQLLPFAKYIRLKRRVGPGNFTPSPSQNRT